MPGERQASGRARRDRAARAELAVFRADASAGTGGGHVVRCLALAEALAAEGWRCAFACRGNSLATVPALARAGHEIVEVDGEEPGVPRLLAASWPDGADWLVVDHYGWNRDLESACRPWAGGILAIDDLADRPHECDVLLDQTLDRIADDYAGLVPADCILLLGSAYALLREEFFARRDVALARRQDRRGIGRIAVAMGTTDPGNLTRTALEAIGRECAEARVDLVLGSRAPHLASVRRRISERAADVSLHVDAEDVAGILADADLAIGAGGGSAWERCCLGLPTVLCVLAQNQRAVARALAAAGAARVVGEAGTPTADEMAAALHDLARDPDAVGRMSAAAARLCDGLGARRVAAALCPERAADGGAIRLRPATGDDGEAMFAWQCHPETRRFANDPGPPARDEHFRWLEGKLADRDCLLNMVLHGNDAAGVLRLDRERDGMGGGPRYRVSIYVAPRCYRLGLAGGALALARRLLPSATLTAEVLAGNEGSHRLFRKAGYVARDGLYVSSPERSTRP